MVELPGPLLEAFNYNKHCYRAHIKEVRKSCWPNLFKAVFVDTLYRIVFRAETKYNPIYCDNLSDILLSTLKIGVAQLRSAAEIAPIEITIIW